MFDQVESFRDLIRRDSLFKLHVIEVLQHFRAFDAFPADGGPPEAAFFGPHQPVAVEIDPLPFRARLDQAALGMFELVLIPVAAAAHRMIDVFASTLAQDPAVRQTLLEDLGPRPTSGIDGIRKGPTVPLKPDIINAGAFITILPGTIA